MECFLGLLDEDRASNDYYDEANCSFALALVFLHCFSIICVGIAVDKIVNAGATKVMYRGKFENRCPQAKFERTIIMALTPIMSLNEPVLITVLFRNQRWHYTSNDLIVHL